MVKSRNQGFLDLTALLTEKSVYKGSSQENTWGYDFYLGELLFFLFLGSQVFSWRTFSCNEKRIDYELHTS